jgi:hypothetical protein
MKVLFIDHHWAHFRPLIESRGSSLAEQGLLATSHL